MQNNITDFGDYLYGTEPLTLPYWKGDEQGFEALKPSEFRFAQLKAQADMLHQSLLTEAVHREVDWLSLFWFRWITGHQMSFIIWQVLIQHLETLKTDSTDAAEQTLRECTILMKSYAAMLVYTTSCPTSVYEEIRTFMLLHHKSFSGTWAVEYRRLKIVIEQTIQQCVQDTGIHADVLHDFRDMFTTSKKVHFQMARILLPDAQSAMQAFKTSGEGSAPPTTTAQFYFDNFFLVQRGPVSLADMAHALISRVAATCCDIQVHQLYPLALFDNPPVADDDGAVLLFQQQLIPSLLEAVDVMVSQFQSQELSAYDSPGRSPTSVMVVED